MTSDRNKVAYGCLGGCLGIIALPFMIGIISAILNPATYRPSSEAPTPAHVSPTQKPSVSSVIEPSSQQLPPSNKPAPTQPKPTSDRPKPKPLPAQPATPKVSPKAKQPSPQVVPAATPRTTPKPKTSPKKPRPIRKPKVGNCECPYDTDRAGRACGARSAYSKLGGRSGAQCYTTD